VKSGSVSTSSDTGSLERNNGNHLLQRNPLAQAGNLAQRRGNGCVRGRAFDAKRGDEESFGDQFTFLPQASLWSNPFGLQLLASSLTERAKVGGE
jgi:hypothetical protein